MEHKNRWLTRLYLMKLEDRMQPGTLLSTGLDATVLAGSIDQPNSQRAVKRINSSEDIQIVSTEVAGTAELVGAPTSSTRASQATPHQQVSEKATNPAINNFVRPDAGEKVTIGNREMVKQVDAPVNAIEPIATRVDSNPLVTHYDNGVIGTAVGSNNNGGSGTRAAVWAHYDTTPPAAPNLFGATDRVDRVNDVHVGLAGPCTDHTFSAGVIGRTGTVKIYAPDAVGTLVHQLNVPLTPGTRSEIKAITEGPGGVIYAVGSTRTALAPAGALINNYIAMWAPPPGPGCGPLVPVQFPAAIVTYLPASGVLELNDVDFQAGAAGGFSVSAVGTVTAAPVTNIFVANWDAGLVGPPTDLSIGFLGAGGLPTSTQGYSITMDDGSAPGPGPAAAPCSGGPAGLLATRYIGGVFDSTGLIAGGGASLFFMDLFPSLSLAEPCDWAFFGGPSAGNFLSAYPDVETGYYGVTQDGPALFWSGGREYTAASAFQPGLNTASIRNSPTTIGTPATYSINWGVAASNWYNKRNAVAPGGGAASFMYSAGSLDNFGLGVGNTITQGDATEWDPFGTPVTFQESACTAVVGEDTDGFGIAYHIGSGDVSVGGRTNAPEPEWSAGGCIDAFSVAQPLSAVDSVFGGTGGQSATGGPPTDGYVYRMNTPLGP